MSTIFFSEPRLRLMEVDHFRNFRNRIFSKYHQENGGGVYHQIHKKIKKSKKSKVISRKKEDDIMRRKSKDSRKQNISTLVVTELLHELIDSIFRNSTITSCVKNPNKISSGEINSYSECTTIDFN